MNEIHTATFIQKAQRWVEEPWCVKRSQGYIYGEQWCDNCPLAFPVYTRVCIEAQKWVVMTLVLSLKLRSSTGSTLPVSTIRS